MRKILVIIFCCISIGIFDATKIFAETPFQSLENKYQTFTEKLETKYSSIKIREILERLSLSLDTLIGKKDISPAKRDYIRFLYELNRQKINFLASMESKSGSEIQKSKEFKYSVILKAQTKRKNQPQIITELQKKDKKLYLTNSVYEFYDEESKEINKIIFKNFYKITPDIIPLISTIDGIIVSPKEGEYIFIETYSFEKKYPFSLLYNDKDFQKRFIDLDKKYVLENNTYFTYIFTQYQVFSDEYGFYESIFTRNNIDTSNIIFVRDSESRFGYVADYKKVKLISQELTEGVENKDKFLSTVADDKKYLFGDSDNDFKNLKKTVNNLITKTDTKEEKIKKIYAWILENISYSKEFDIEDKQIFSGIDTFGDHEGVCDGYVKLMTYMLLYAGVNEVEIIRGDVIDAQDFPYIGHAWLKIGDYYYDPTFEDPIGLIGSVPYEKYKFFKLPKDILYSNRFDYADTPESLKKTPLSERQEIIKRNLWNLSTKYEKGNFLLLQPFILKKKYGIEYSENFSIEIMKKNLPFIEQTSATEAIVNGKKQLIKKLSYSYYVVEDQKNIEPIMESLQYDITNIWLLKTLQGEYRIGYDVVVQ